MAVPNMPGTLANGAPKHLAEDDLELTSPVTRAIGSYRNDPAISKKGKGCVYAPHLPPLSEYSLPLAPTSSASGLALEQEHL